MEEFLLELKNVSFASRDIQIINDLNISVERGTTTAILGQSGSGKSTVLKLLAGLLVPSRGKLLYKGADVATMSMNQQLQFRKESAFVFQDAALWANQNIQQIMELPLKIHFPDSTAKERLLAVRETLQAVGYTRNIALRPADLSAGEQKKVALARALVYKPEILFLDECTASLDQRSASKIMRILKNLQSNGCTIMYVSHDDDFIEAFQGTVLIIKDGALEKTMNFEQYNEGENIEI